MSLPCEFKEHVCLWQDGEGRTNYKTIVNNIVSCIPSAYQYHRWKGVRGSVGVCGIGAVRARRSCWGTVGVGAAGGECLGTSAAASPHHQDAISNLRT